MFIGNLPTCSRLLSIKIRPTKFIVPLWGSHRIGLGTPSTDNLLRSQPTRRLIFDKPASLVNSKARAMSERGSLVEQNVYVEKLIESGILDTQFVEEALDDEQQAPRDKQKNYVYAIIYDYIPNVLARRGQYREEHLTLCKKYSDKGKALLGGAWGNPIHGALLIFHVERKEDIYNFISADPYVRNGLVTKISVRPWNIVVGSLQDQIFATSSGQAPM